MDSNTSTDNMTVTSTASESHDDEVEHDSFSFASLQVLVFVISAMLNILTVGVFVTSRLLHTTNNFLVASLALSDFCYITLVISTSLVSLINDVHYAHLTCTLLGYWMQVIYCLSINICCLISFHRFVSILYPQSKILWSMHSAQQAMVLMIIFTALSCIPGAVRFSYGFNNIVATCALLRPAGGDQTFSVYVFVLNFTLPSSLMVMFYLSIYQRIVRNRMSLVKEMVHSSLLRKKTKWLLAAVLFIYFFCWTPYYVLLLCTSWGDMVISHHLMILVWVAKLLSTVAHPILYAMCNRLFMHCILRSLRCRPHPREWTLGETADRGGPTLLRPSMFTARVGVANQDNISTIGSLPPIEELSKFRRQMKASIFSSDTMTTGSSDSTPYQQAEQNLIARRGRLSRQDSTPTVLRMPMRGEMTASTLGFGRTPLPGSNRSSCVSRQYTPFGSNRSSCVSRVYTPINDPNFDNSRGVTREDSIPTILRMPIDRMNSMTESQYAFGRTPPPDSRRESFASNSVQGYSARTSFSSFYVPSARTSVASSYAYSYFNTPQGTRPNSVAENGKGLRHSARSSLSRSNNSSLSSYPQNSDSSLPSTPNYPEMRLSSTNVESIYIPPPDDNLTEQQQQQYRRSFQQTQMLEKIVEHRDQDIAIGTWEPDEESSPGNPSSDDTVFMPGTSSSAETAPDRSSPRNRISAVMFGDIAPEEACALVKEEEEHERRMRKRGGALWQLARKLPQLNPKVRKAVEILLNLQQNAADQPASAPRSAPCSPLGWNTEQMTPRPCSARAEMPHTIVEVQEAEDGNEGEARRDSFYDTMEKAVYLVLKAKRIHSKMKSSSRRVRQDSPEPMVHTLRQMPVRYVYEKPIPTSSQMPMMQLRVPGVVPFRVPQTIFEEDAVDLPPPETPSRKRKNASSWIAPPVIDREQGETRDMRVSTPGVLVEHHH